MRKIFKITYTTGYNGSNEYAVNVLAKDAAQAVDHVKRYGKRKHYGEVEIVALEKVLGIDVEYKS